jgi:hypothetical protein
VERYGLDMDVVVSGLAGATIYIAKNWAQTGFKHSLDEILMHNMLIYRSLDAVYKQMGEQQPKPGKKKPALPPAPPIATRTPKKGRRASDA